MANLPAPVQTPESGPTSQAATTPVPTPYVPIAVKTPRLPVPEPAAVFSHGDSRKAKIYITVDDCSNWPNVEKDIEIAKDNNVQITLFPAGKYIDAHRSDAAEALQRAVAYGDEVDNHTYSHTIIAPGTTGWAEDLAAQLATVRTALNDPHYQEWFVRPPFGLGLDNMDFTTAAYKAKLAIAMWSIDSGGYESGSTVPFVMNNVFGKDFKNGGVLLMHSDDTDTEALPLVISMIEQRGFTVGGVLRNILAEDEGIAAGGGTRTQGASSADLVMGREDDPPAS